MSRLRLYRPRQQGRAPLSGLDSHLVAAPTLNSAPIDMRTEQPSKPRLHVKRSEDGYGWNWEIRDGGWSYTLGWARHHAHALTMGLAELDLVYAKRRHQ